jgi:hypothetical protein
MMANALGSIFLLATFAATAAGCGGDPEPANTPPPKGTATLRFSASSTVRTNMNLVDPLKGYVYGLLYLSEDVSVTGPRPEAVDYADVELLIDLEAKDPSEAAWTSPPLDPNRYVFLGMFDVDGNGAETGEPEAGDPVTLPFTNQFDITADQETQVTVNFDLVYN